MQITGEQLFMPHTVHLACVLHAKGCNAADGHHHRLSDQMRTAVQDLLVRQLSRGGWP